MGAESLGVVSGAITIPFRLNGGSAPFGENKQINLGTSLTTESMPP